MLAGIPGVSRARRNQRGRSRGKEREAVVRRLLPLIRERSNRFKHLDVHTSLLDWRVSVPPPYDLRYLDWLCRQERFEAFMIFIPLA
jgi:hypothetical protein